MSGPSSRELPTDRLATSDREGRRVYLYPAEVRGRFQRLRAWTHRALIVFFLALPWLRVGGRQAVLLDVANGRFTLFGVTFWAHDAPMLVFIIGGGFLSLGLVTALWGRAWCGWACPQTVFIESAFRAIERLIEGDHVARRRVDESPWSTEKALRKALKWGLFTGVALVIAHSFLAFFVGTGELARMMSRPPAESPAGFAVMAGLSALILFDFGWFREQFCTVVCPYGRFQSLLMDEHSSIIAYDTKRGEPRAAKGDCVNCYRCVQVCPTGIDIRRGTQLECIACTACADACDDVMARLHKPAGLIRYDSAVGLQGKPRANVRGRTIAYALLIVLAVTGLAASLATRRDLAATIVRAADSPYQVITAEGGRLEVINRFHVDLSNQGFEDLRLGLEPAPEFARQGVVFVFAAGHVDLAAGRKATGEFFVRFPKGLLRAGHALIQLNVTGSSGPVLTEELNLVGPFQ